MNEIVALSLDSLRKNMLRSFLTILGIVIGVATVIGMSSIISGLNGSIAAQIQSIGSNLIFLYRFDPIAPGRRPPEELNRKSLTLEDAEALRDLPAVQSVAPTLRWFQPSGNATSFTVRYRDRIAKNTIIEGITPQHEQVLNLELSEGRWINEADHSHKANVVVIGHDTAETISPANVDPVGKEVELEGTVFRVIGVLAKRKNALTPGANADDNVAEVPIGTFWRLHPEFKDFWIIVRPVAQELMPQAIDRIEQVLRRRRGVPPNKDSDFSIFTQDS